MTKLKSVQLWVLLALMLGGTVTFGQDSMGARPKKARTPEDYKPRTLKEIETAGKPLLDELKRDTQGGATTLIHGDLFPSRVRLVYKGSVRPLTPNRKAIISQWAQRYAGYPEHYTVPYTSEVLFAENGVNRWLVVKTDDSVAFRNKLRRGAVVDLYLIRLGAFKSGTSWKWVLLAEKFAGAK